MRMTSLEKRLVNRKKKAERNIGKLRERLDEIPTESIHDALELGCGTGVVSAFLAKTYGMNVRGTDFDPEQIESAKAMNPETGRLHFQTADAARLKFPDSSFDLVVSQNVFHHVPNWKGAVREAGRVLRPNGYLVWYDLAFPAWVVKVFRPILKNYGIYTFEEVRSEFAEAGFRALSQERLAHGPFSHHQLVLRKQSRSDRPESM